MADLFGYERPTQTWQSETVRNVRVTLRNTSVTLAVSPAEQTHYNIEAMQLRENYAVVIMPNGHAFIYPYATLLSIETLPTMDTSDAARAAAVEQFRSLQAGGNGDQLEIPKGAGPKES